MNTIKKIQFLILATVGLLLTHSCVQDDDFAIPPIVCNDTWETNLTISDLFSQVNSANGILSFDTDQILEGYVVSSDSTGNFFKTVSVQDSPSDPNLALQVEMDRTNLFNNFPLGSKIKINLNGLNVGYDRGALKIGETYQDANGNTRVGRMAESKIDSHVAKSCDPIQEIQPVVYNSIYEAIDATNSVSHINTLVTIHNVQFAQIGVTYADEVTQTTVNLTLEGATEATQNQTTVLRTSGFADFAGVVVPEGSGSITAVLSAYDSNNNGSISRGEYQLFIRDTNDVQFDNPRFGGGGGGSGDGPGPIGGGDAEFVSCLSENFESYAPDTEEFPAYENNAYSGSRYWGLTSFGGNKYIQMTAFNSDDAVNTTYFVVPVNFSEADTFSFKTKDGYNNGNVLTVYYSTNYTLGGDIAAATLVDITSAFNISTGNTAGYGANFVESGAYSLASLSGNGVLIFKYEGGSGVTTTMQIDDIAIINNEDPDCGNGGGGGDDPNPPADDASPLFPGHDFEDWTNFLGGLNSFGIKPYATQSAGTGLNGGASLKIATNPTTTDTNDYVFTTLATTPGVPATYNRITFYVKGNSEKSVSLNLYKNDGTYYVFNLGDLTSSTSLSVAANNQYTGIINTGGEWVLVELDLTGITDLTTDAGSNLFALKIGKNANYDLHFDNFTIE